MANEESNSGHTDASTLPAEAQQLDSVVDDLQPRMEASDWACEELLKGRLAEEVAADLVGNGWGEEDADQIVEEQRQATRRLRGVVTREDVAGAAAARYRKSMRLKWARIGIVVVAVILFLGIRYLRSIRNSQPPTVPASGTTSVNQQGGAHP